MELIAAMSGALLILLAFAVGFFLKKTNSPKRDE